MIVPALRQLDNKGVLTLKQDKNNSDCNNTRVQFHKGWFCRFCLILFLYSLIQSDDLKAIRKKKSDN